MAEDFISKCISADATVGEIYNYIDRWHSEVTDMPVYAYLGMTYDEYFLWLKNECTLVDIIEAHRRTE